MLTDKKDLGNFNHTSRVEPDKLAYIMRSALLVGKLTHCSLVATRQVINFACHTVGPRTGPTKCLVPRL